VTEAQFLSHDPVTVQVVCDDHRDPMLLHQGLQPTPYGLRVIFVHIAHRDGFACSQIHCHHTVPVSFGSTGRFSPQPST
jgi:hypothetical protein